MNEDTKQQADTLIAEMSAWLTDDKTEDDHILWAREVVLRRLFEAVRDLEF